MTGKDYMYNKLKFTGKLTNFLFAIIIALKAYMFDILSKNNVANKNFKL